MTAELIIIIIFGLILVIPMLGFAILALLGEKR
jgi:hypothetical protein